MLLLQPQYLSVLVLCISLIGAGLLLYNKIPSGTITSAIGLVSSVRYFEFARDANDRLDKILNEVEEEN